MVLVEHHNVVQAFTTNGSDHAFDIRILPRRTWCNENLLDRESMDATREVSAVDTVVVTDQIAGDRVPGKRFDELSSGPFGRGMLGDVEVSEAPPVMGEHEEHKQNAERHGGHGEEVDGDEILDVILQERPPIRARGFAWRIMYLATVVWDKSMPSFKSSP